MADRWFKHHSHTITGDGMAELALTHGCIGYTVLFILREMQIDKEGGAIPLSSLISNCRIWGIKADQTEAVVNTLLDSEVLAEDSNGIWDYETRKDAIALLASQNAKAEGGRKAMAKRWGGKDVV